MKSTDAVIALAALAQGTRLEIFRTLVKAGPNGIPAGALAETLELAPATLSFHLKELRNAGLAQCTRAGRQRIYRPDFERARDLVSFLSEKCCQGITGSEAGGETCCPLPNEAEATARS